MTGMVRKFQTGQRCRINGTEMLFRKRGDVKFLSRVDIELLDDNGNPIPTKPKAEADQKGA